MTSLTLKSHLYEAFLDSSGSLDYNKDAKKDVEIDISTSNIKEQVHHPIVQLEGRNIDDLWNDYNNLTQEQFKALTVKDFNLIIETFRKFLKGSDFSDKSLIYHKSYQYSIFVPLTTYLCPRL
ncbi:hypothetical protein RhiirA1_470652 [Rhizophagus irregularis]|uniref:Uncharacterized protein n=1 Tax=Rhizophagus irregularis TaxID=588596 RepID=A0A2N0R5R3_9GLOM|nr:hypothetical protein RhiirA1_470652 [Rhizophagus irregularis]CAB4482330.1 unnamed protein product [Rhizophagus irregularis]